MNILITGGGTGGHLAIAQAMGIALKNKGHQVFYIGSVSGQDRDWFENCNLFEKCYFLNTKGVVNQKGLGILHSIFLQWTAWREARKILRTHQIQRVLSVGGFSAGPASFGAISLGVSFFIHEQNAIKGTLNKLLSPFAKKVFGSFSHSGKNYIRTSYPIRNDFFLHSRIRQKVEYVIFLGGSQGAKAINDFALLCAKGLLEKGIKIIHQCGKNDFERVKNAYEALGLKDSMEQSSIELFDFRSDLINLVSKADVCVGRAGASTAWELCANGLVALFVPYPYAASDHQYYNALEFQNAGLGAIVRQNELEVKHLFDFIDKLEQVGEDGVKNITQMSLGLREKIHPDGADEIAKQILG
ncbi:UDP-N-acetylglucosamine--N-acetylmuramyl-(pentapeptide) pyrophosphoryl-undecaprenol N-acetylglucosamine transferase [Helicobacter sp. 11S02596-1]|uniref:UDP-N-acetylglucosamine--N-acetylmuramyl- (pentapeptide) pyrophosphoryl-undecaprenol N-acetylglucosamine transferase n=1 Tax=Helicobacter sp. 11S02596-1 TaxID=1476194 RepID=UPI000BA74726|nr:UDP-N-acetylglucosamine--N-acetylmuramyl-(pentapeptide) pyrophosphoryl-undecaprenol N-acetylglucosamine transferase [Helicobacter sp. 11S02596-1]PAF42351.1 UDP-N-acetylglucosamine--N-acetylmuramyl-(pentapeptide) pyrophosphoryl-undecaprenol N-acetylglucosamine transferase [Helicobacter sp. 11S02596-1]